MKTGRSYLLPSILLLSSVFMINKGMDVKKEAALTAAKITVEQAKVTSTEAKPTDIITAKQLIDSLALKAGLPIVTSIEKNTISMLPKSVSDTKTDTSTAILYRYDEMMDFMTSISSLPYKMEYGDFCIGKECETGFNVKINILGV